MQIDLSTQLITKNKTIELPNPLIGASGSFGHSDELFDVIDPAEVGAITIKSLAAFESPGNASPRLAPSEGAMLNSVGLPGPHIEDWIKSDLSKLDLSNGRFIMAIWGRSVDEYQKAAALISGHLEKFIALEVNLSCPNTELGSKLFAQDPDQTAKVITAVRNEINADVAVTAKLSANVTSIVDIAQAAIEAGSDILTLFNTLMGLKLDPYTRKPVLGKGAGGYSGNAIMPIVQKGIYDVHTKFPDTPIIGTGGVTTGTDVASMMMCGASAVGIATATFADPRAIIKIKKELHDFCFDTAVSDVSDIIGEIQMP